MVRETAWENQGNTVSNLVVCVIVLHFGFSFPLSLCFISNLASDLKQEGDGNAF